MKFIVFTVLMFCTALAILLSGLRLPAIIALAVLFIAVGLDFLTTYICLKKGGKESNPIIEFFIKRVGVLGTFGIVAGVWIAFLFLRFLPSSDGGKTAVAITYWLVPINNFMVMKRLDKKNKAK